MFTKHWLSRGGASNLIDALIIPNSGGDWLA